MQENKFQQPDQDAVDNDLKTQQEAAAETADGKLEELPEPNLAEELAQAQAKAAENYDLYVRAVAETDNVRRRSAEEVQKARKFGIERFAESLLPVVDSMEKALEASNQEQGHLKEGLEITYRQMLSALENNGMKSENPLGLKFDPNTMQAIAMIDAPEVQSGCVAQVFQKGWKIADRVLRPAMVAVAK